MRTLVIALALAAFVSPVAAQKHKPAQKPKAAPQQSDPYPPPSWSSGVAQPGYEPEAAPVTLDRLDNFPEDYAGKTLVLSGLFLDGEPNRHDEFFTLAVSDRETKKYVSSFLFGKGIAFVASNELVRGLQEHLKAGYDYNVRITCHVENSSAKGSPRWVANISQVEGVAILSGRVVWTVSGPPAKLD